MEDVDKTYNVLKRIPWEEMDEHLRNLPRHTAVYNFSGNVFESRKNELVRHYERIKLLEENGWSFETFVLEAERRNIIEAINEYNKENAFPLELVERAKEFFPNARFTQAKIELE
jgi:hypothetical protein